MPVCRLRSINRSSACLQTGYKAIVAMPVCKLAAVRSGARLQTGCKAIVAMPVCRLAAGRSYSDARLQAGCGERPRCPSAGWLRSDRSVRGARLQAGFAIRCPSAGWLRCDHSGARVSAAGAGCGAIVAVPVCRLAAGRSPFTFRNTSLSLALSLSLCQLIMISSKVCDVRWRFLRTRTRQTFQARKDI